MNRTLTVVNGETLSKATPVATPLSVSPASQSSKYTSMQSAALTLESAKFKTDDEVAQMDLESFLDGFQIMSPPTTPSHDTARSLARGAPAAAPPIPPIPPMDTVKQEHAQITDLSTSAKSSVGGSINNSNFLRFRLSKKHVPRMHSDSSLTRKTQSQKGTGSQEHIQEQDDDIGE